MSSTLNEPLNQFVFNDDRFDVTIIPLDLLQSQSNQFSVAGYGRSQFCGAQNLHANLKFIGGDILRKREENNRF